MKAMVERIFLWFGGVRAVLARRTATASVSSTCFYTAVGLAAALVVDISYGFIDPRIRMGSKK